MDGVLEVERGGMVSLASDVWSPSYMVLEVLTGTPAPWSELGGACEVGELLLLVGVPSSNGKEEIAQKKKNKKKEYEIWVPQTKGNYRNTPCKFGDIDGIVTWEERG